MAKETNQLKFGDFQVIVIMVTYSQKVFYLGYVLKKVPNHYPDFFPLYFTPKGFEAMKAGMLVAQPWLSWRVTENTLMD